MNIKKIINLKSKKKINMVTCYDYTSATIVEQSNIEMVLVGDSAAMVMHGYPDTTYATMEMMVHHTSAVSRGLKSKLLIADLPFMSYRKTIFDTMSNVQSLIQAGAHAIKLEGAKGNLDIIRHIVESGVPVMGHIGLTPQHVHNLGGFKVQGKQKESWTVLIEQAKALELAGCFSVVIECVPAELANQITLSLQIPTIGIGAGQDTDGQVLVWQDLLGMQNNFRPKFVKHFLNGHEIILMALNQFSDEVESKIYPDKIEHIY